MGIIAHCLVKDEERFIWFAVNSVIDYVDGIMVWDNGSGDSTTHIIKSIKNPKIEFRDASDIRPEVARQQMLDQTKSDWFFILDGDEIWWDQTIKNLKLKIENSDHDVVVVPNYMLVGDIFHYQEEVAGKYKIGGRVGHYNIRAVRKSPGLHVERIYPDEVYVTKEGIKVQDLPKEKMIFLDEPYLHASFLSRSNRGEQKNKYEIGESFSKDLYYPEVFFRDRPGFVPSPWETINWKYKLNAFWQTPLKKIRRRVI